MKVFISHGHDETAKDKIKNFISSIPGMEPVILAEMLESGQTIIEGLEKFSGVCEFAVILLTADDITNDGDYRARQNVIHECGFFQGLLGRKKVVLVAQKNVQIPSNLDGLYKLDFRKDSEEIFPRLKNILEKGDASVSAQVIKSDNSQSEQIFIQHKKDFYELLKKKKFTQIGNDYHKRTYKHKDGEKLDLIIDVKGEFFEKTKNKEYFFIFIREYIDFNKKNRKTYKKGTDTYENKIPVESTFNQKRIALEAAIEDMEEHIKISESVLEAKSRKDDRNEILYPIIAFLSVIAAFAIMFITLS